MSEDRTRGSYGPPDGNIRWFKLYDNLAEFNKALAYPCNWLKSSNKWQASTVDAERRYVYSTISGLTGSANDFLPCVYNRRGRVWEVVKPSGPEIHRGVTDSSISKGSSGTVSRYTDGTNTDSGTDDTVNNDVTNVGSGKKCAYVKIGSNFYMIYCECPVL